MYDDGYGDDYPVGYYPVGYPVGAVRRSRPGEGYSAPRPGRGSRGGRTRTPEDRAGIIGRRPRPTLPREGRVNRRSGGIVGPRPDEMFEPVFEALPYFGDEEAEMALARQRQMAEASLQEARQRMEIQRDIAALQQERSKLLMGGVPTADGGSLGGSAKGMLHGSAVYTTEIPLSLEVAGGASDQLTYQVNRYFRVYRVLAADATTADNFLVNGFRDNGRQLRESYAQGGGVPASIFSQDDERLAIVLPWIGVNNRFSIDVVNTDTVNPQTAKFIVFAVESESDPADFDPEMASSINKFFRAAQFSS